MNNLSWNKRPPYKNLYGVPIEELQKDWNQTLMPIINLSMKSVNETLLENGKRFHASVQPQMSCSADAKEIIETLASYFKDEKYFRSGLNGRHVMVDFNNPKPNTIEYSYAGVIAEIQLIDNIPQ